MWQPPKYEILDYRNVVFKGVSREPLTSFFRQHPSFLAFVSPDLDGYITVCANGLATGAPGIETEALTICKQATLELSAVATFFHYHHLYGFCFVGYKQGQRYCWYDKSYIDGELRADGLSQFVTGFGNAGSDVAQSVNLLTSHSNRDGVSLHAELFTLMHIDGAFHSYGYTKLQHHGGPFMETNTPRKEEFIAVGASQNLVDELNIAPPYDEGSLQIYRPEIRSDEEFGNPFCVP